MKTHEVRALIRADCPPGTPPDVRTHRLWIDGQEIETTAFSAIPNTPEAGLHTISLTIVTDAYRWTLAGGPVEESAPPA